MKLSNSEGMRMETAVMSESGCGPAMVRRLEVKTHDLVVENYSSIRNLIGLGNGISSEEFVCGGHRWRVMFAPDGSDADAHKKGFASIFIVRTTQATRNEPFTFNIELLDQSGSQKNLAFCHSFYGEVLLLEPRDRAVGPSEFILRAELDSPDCPYVKNDSLKIRAVVGAFTYHAAPSSFKVKEWDDVIVFIHVADRTFLIPFFAILDHCPKLLWFDRDYQLHDIVFPEADPCVFRVALSFVSLPVIRDEDKHAIDDSDPLNLESFAAKLLAVANMLKLTPFKTLCEESLSKKISRESVAHLLHLAHVCKAAKLKSACLKFVAQNRLAIIESHKSQLLKEKCQLLFLELPEDLEDSPFFQDNNPFTTLKQGVLKMYDTVLNKAREFEVGRHWPRFSANKFKQLYRNLKDEDFDADQFMKHRRK